MLKSVFISKLYVIYNMAGFIEYLEFACSACGVPFSAASVAAAGNVKTDN